MAAKKTSFYYTRNKILPNKEAAADLLGVDVAEIDRMDKEGAPVMAERLLLLWDKKYINMPGWDGWLFSRDVLCYKKRRYRPDMILRYQDQENEVSKLNNEILKLYSWHGLLKILKKIW